MPRKRVYASNLRAPVLDVRHAQLERSDDSPYRSVCPMCHEGLLLMRRDPQTFILQDTDICCSCGQRFKYIDIEEVGKVTP